MPIELTGLRDRVAVVTGAGRFRGFGRAIALRLAEGGCDVLVTETARPPESFPKDEREAGWRGAASVVEEIERLGRRARHAVLDVADEDAVNVFAEEATTLMGKVDFVVNNAAAPIGVSAEAIELPTATWRSKIAVNLDGAFFVSRALGRRMVGQGGGGAIVNVSSIAGKIFPTRTAAYAASKAGLQALTGCMAQELAPHAIRVNAICPGLVDTSHLDPSEGTDAWDRAAREFGPRLRPGRVEDIANMTAFLCSEEASWITGQSYNVDGGRTVAH